MQLQNTKSRRGVNGPVHKATNHVPKAVSDRDPLPDWVRDLNYVRSQALQTPSRSRKGSLRCEINYFVPTAQSALIDPCMASPRISKMHTHESRSKRALRSHVLRIRLSTTRITIQTPLFPRFKSLISKSFAFTQGKIELSNQERVRITFRNGFRNVIHSFVNRPNV